MKYAIIIPDGCSDFPIDSLGGLTPLQSAETPNMNRIASLGIVGQTDNVPRHFPAGSEVANMTLFGYDPNLYFTGRAPIEAAAQGVQLDRNDLAVRCNLVTITDQVMLDFTADHISTEEARCLLADLQDAVGREHFEFVPGVSYRNLMMYRGGQHAPPFDDSTRSTAPHDLTDLPVIDGYPRGPGSDLLCELMQKSEEIFRDHPVNRERIAQGKRPATNVWLWGLGPTPQLTPFEKLHGIRGAMITAVDLLRGLAALIGWDRIEVDGATGYLDTNYQGKGDAAVSALDRFDIVCVHIEATDEASHEGRVDEKIKALERIDEAIVGPVIEKLHSFPEHRVLVLPDHPTPCSTKKHTHGWVPFAMAGTGIKPDTATEYHEVSAAESNNQFPQGWELMPAFLRKPLDA